MKKYLIVVACLLVVGLVWAGSETKISRLCSGIAAVGYGATQANTRTLVVSDQSANEVQVLKGNVSVTGAATSGVVTFTDTFTGVPQAFIAPKTGAALSTIASCTITATASNLTISGMATGAVDSVQYIVVGNRRSGVLSQ